MDPLSMTKDLIYEATYTKERRRSALYSPGHGVSNNTRTQTVASHRMSGILPPIELSLFPRC